MPDLGPPQSAGVAVEPRTARGLLYAVFVAVWALAFGAAHLVMTAWSGARIDSCLMRQHRSTGTWEGSLCEEVLTPGWLGLYAWPGLIATLVIVGVYATALVIRDLVRATGNAPLTVDLERAAAPQAQQGIGATALGTLTQRGPRVTESEPLGSR